MYNYSTTTKARINSYTVHNYYFFRFQKFVTITIKFGNTYQYQLQQVFETLFKVNIGQKLIFFGAFSIILIKQCLVEPLDPLYGGGIIVNPEFNHNTEGWKAFGEGRIEVRRTSKHGNKFIVAHNRTHPLDSFSQMVQVEEGKIYSFSGN